jgi:hypothetical protein
MTKMLYVQMSVPIECRPIVSLPAVLFAGWLPDSSSDHIIVDKDRLRAELWFDRSCLNYPAGTDPLTHDNILAHALKLEVAVDGLDDEFIQAIIDASKLPSPEGTPFSDRYEELGKEIYDLTMITVNRLITFVRVDKLQYWLQELEVDAGRMASAFVHFQAVCSIDRANWYMWRPTSRELMLTVLPYRTTWITREDWITAGEYVRSGRSGKFVPDLLATAIANAWSGNRRSALVEAVTALEVAVSEFARSPKSEQAFGKIFSERMDVSSLKSQVSHMGISGSIKYLFPVIVPEASVSNESFRTCSKALEERNNVVHNGQRDVSPSKIHKYITSIEKICSYFIEHTNDDEILGSTA